MTAVTLHYEDTLFIPASPEKLFEYIDDHKRFSSHMSQYSWMMAGSKEVVTHHEPPHLKAWKTVGPLRLLIIGDYEMKVEIKSHKDESLLSVSINYDLPKTNVWLGKLFGSWYAKWCVQQMLKRTISYFNNTEGG